MNPHDVVKLAAAALAAAATLGTSYAWRVDTLTPPPDAIELIAPATCTTDADCHARHPDIPEPGHDESDVCDEPACFADRPEAEGAGVPVPSVSEGLGSLGYLPCENEDGPGPCFWDAQNMGDGNGSSYVLLSDGSAIYLQ